MTLFEWDGVPVGGPGGIALQTRLGTPIENSQSTKLYGPDLAEHEALLKKFGGTGVVFKGDPNPWYNCHGLSFASRRTWIHQHKDIMTILKEDGYPSVPMAEVQVGDVVLYLGPDSDLQHSAIVVRAPSTETHGMPVVWGKWGAGAEVIHPANVGAYANGATLKAYRIRP